MAALEYVVYTHTLELSSTKKKFVSYYVAPSGHTEDYEWHWVGCFGEKRRAEDYAQYLNKGENNDFQE